MERAYSSRCAADKVNRSDRLTVTMAPLSGCAGRNFFSSVRKPVQAAESTSRLLLWVV